VFLKYRTTTGETSFRNAFLRNGSGLPFLRSG
jgi:hypothetical protein